MQQDGHNPCVINFPAATTEHRVLQELLAKPITMYVAQYTTFTVTGQLVFYSRMAGLYKLAFYEAAVNRRRIETL